jgi:hypothetical protein
MDSGMLKDAIGVLLGLVTASIAIGNWKATRFRTTLRDDLDILRRYREEFGGAPHSCDGQAEFQRRCLFCRRGWLLVGESSVPSKASAGAGGRLRSHAQVPRA